VEHKNDNFLLRLSYDTVKELDPLFVQLPEWLRWATCLHEYLFAPSYAVLALCIALRLRTATRTLCLWVGPSLAYAVGFYTLLEFFGDLPTPDRLMWSIVNLDYFCIALLLPFASWRHFDTKKKKRERHENFVSTFTK